MIKFSKKNILYFFEKELYYFILIIKYIIKLNRIKK